jgi:serine protease Do
MIQFADNLNYTFTKDIPCRHKMLVRFLGIILFCLCFSFNFTFSVFSQQNIRTTLSNDDTKAEVSLSLFSEVARKVQPAVVNIDAFRKDSEITVKSSSGTKPEDSILDIIENEQISHISSVGSGFFIDSKGFILTNEHVVQDSLRIIIGLQNGEKYRAMIVGTDKITDLAVLKIDSKKEFPTMKLGNSDTAQVGEWVLAIGSPFGLAQSVTAGIISQTKRETPAFNVEGFSQQFIQTDTAINFGNSGGPLVNLKGEVIGINSQVAISNGNSNGIGFALPSNDANYVYKQILANGKVKRGYLGVVLESVKSEFAKIYELAEAKGAIITELRDKESPAGKAGLLVGDILIEFDGKKIENAQDLITKVASTEPDKAVSISYFREIGTKLENRTALLKLAERPSNNKIYSAEPVRRKLGNPETSPFGLTLSEITPQVAKSQSLENQKGLFIKDVSNDSIFTEITNASGAIALKTGDVLQKINRAEVGSIKNFSEIVSKLKKGDAVVLHILSFNRQNRSYQARIVQFTVQ